MGKKSAAGTPALVAAGRAGIAHEVHTYESASEDYGTEAAEIMADRLGIDPARVFKTLVVSTSRPPAGARVSLAVAVLPVTARLDLKLLASALGVPKVAMAPVDEVERVTGYVVGGVSPLGQKRALPTVVDASALDFDTVFCSAGRRGWEIELGPGDLVELTGAVSATVTA